MIQSFNDYLAARNQAFHESERIQQLEIQLWGNPRLGPKAQDLGEERIGEMKLGLTMLREVISDYEAEQITPTLKTRLAARQMERFAETRATLNSIGVNPGGQS